MDTITIKAGTQYAINSVLYEIANDYTVYIYDGGVHDTEKVVATPVTITGLNAASSVTSRDDGNLYSLYLTTNLELSADWDNWDNSAEIYINGTEEYKGDACWGINGGVLYIQKVISKGITVNSITIKEGTQYTINDVLYEISNDYTVYIKDSVVSETMLYDITKTINGTTTVETVSGDYVLPGISLDGYTLIGWNIGGKLHKIGATLPALQEGYTIEAVFVAFTQIKGAQVRLTTANATEKIGGIRFVCKLEAGEKSDYITQMGILIMPTNYMTNGALTHDNYDPQDENYKNKGYREFVVDSDKMELSVYSQDTSADGTEAYYLNASIVDLYSYNYTRSYSARSFLKVTYADGTTDYVYTDYSTANNARRICDIAKKMIATYPDEYSPLRSEKYPIVYKYAKVADDMGSFGYFGPTAYGENAETEIATYASYGFKQLWLNSIYYHYHCKYGVRTQEDEQEYYENPEVKFDLQNAMELADKYGLKVIVYDVALRALSEMDISLIVEEGQEKQLLGLWLQTGTGTTVDLKGTQIDKSLFDETNMTYPYEGASVNGLEDGQAKVLNYLWQFDSETELKNYIAILMSQYVKENSFAGVMLVDEPTESQYAQAALVSEIIMGLYPNTYLQSSSLPCYSEASKINMTDTEYAAWQAKWDSYLSQNKSANEVGINFYPFITWSYDLGIFEISNESVREYYLASLQYLATTTRDSGQKFELGVQTHALEGTYAAITSARLKLQVNLGLAFGADTIGYYSYNNDTITKSNGTTMNGFITENSDLTSEVMKAVNRNGNYIKSHMTFFEYQKSNIYGSDDWLDRNKLTISDLTSEIISTQDATILVNEFQNSQTGELGYYIVNITESNTANVTLTKECAIYQDYTEYGYDEKNNEETSETGTSIKLAPGEGAFVIPSVDAQ